MKFRILKKKKKSKKEELQAFEEKFLNIISSKEYGDMISKQMLEVKQRAKKNFNNMKGLFFGFIIVCCLIYCYKILRDSLL